MPTNEEGEFELILGNRQLLSVFFIVVILLGIFFTMGYIVGQHSTPLVTADAGKTPKAPPPAPIVVESPRETAREEPESQPPATQAPPPQPKSPEPARVSTVPQQPAETPKAPPPAKSEPKPEPKAEPVKTAEKEKKSERKAGGEVLPPTPSGKPSGTYLQLAATTKREADIMVDVLRQKKFAATAAEIPEKPGIFRVLVGPITEAQVNKTKSDLQGAGFPGDKSIKRSF